MIETMLGRRRLASLTVWFPLARVSAALDLGAAFCAEADEGLGGGARVELGPPGGPEPPDPKGLVEDTFYSDASKTTMVGYRLFGRDTRVEVGCRTAHWERSVEAGCRPAH